VLEHFGRGKETVRNELRAAAHSVKYSDGSELGIWESKPPLLAQ
jgi:hypothetical protein